MGCAAVTVVLGASPVTPIPEEVLSEASMEEASTGGRFGVRQEGLLVAGVLT